MKRLNLEEVMVKMLRSRSHRRVDGKTEGAARGDFIPAHISNAQFRLALRYALRHVHRLPDSTPPLQSIAKNIMGSSIGVVVQRRFAFSSALVLYNASLRLTFPYSTPYA